MTTRPCRHCRRVLSIHSRRLCRRCYRHHAADYAPRLTFTLAAPRLRELHARGLLDREVAAELGCSEESVGQWRRDLGLASNRTKDVDVRCGRATVAKLVRELDVSSFIAVRWVAERVRCARRGWPLAESRAQADVLDALAAEPRTVRQVVAAQGRAWTPGRSDCVRKLLGKLVRRGLVVRVEKARRGACLAYRLAAGVGRRGEAKAPVAG